MAQPTPYNRVANFVDYAAAHPAATFPPASLDSELDAIETTVDALCANIGLIQRDDGKLSNLSVHPDSLSAATKALMGGWTPRGLWTTAVAYVVGDIVDEAGGGFVCSEAHTAGVFATDYAAGKWVSIAAAATAATSVVFTPAGSIAASNVQAAIQELDTEKAPLDSAVLTGDPKAPTRTFGDNDTSIATTAFVQAAAAVKADADDGTHTGTTAVETLAVSVAASAPTVATTDNSTAVATTAFVRALLVGEIIFVPRATAPDGAVKANGALLTRASYPELWAYAQASGNIAASDAAWSGNPGQFSPGNGSTTFRIPDLRGLIVRGYHDGSGTYEVDTGRGLGSYQADQNKAHTHVVAGPVSGSSSGNTFTSGSTFNAPDNANIGTAQSSGGTEARVRNVALLPCIRY